MGRFIARLLLAALKSETVQTAVAEVASKAARRSTAFLLRKLRAGSRTLNDDSKGRRSAGTPAF